MQVVIKWYIAVILHNFCILKLFSPNFKMICGFGVYTNRRQFPSETYLIFQHDFQYVLKYDCAVFELCNFIDVPIHFLYVSFIGNILLVSAYKLH